MTPYLNLLHNVVEVNSVLHLPNGDTSAITHMGTITLQDSLVLVNVLYVPMFTYNLLSISKLLADNGCTATFSPVTCSLQAPTWTKALEIGKVTNGLYIHNMCTETSTQNADNSSHVVASTQLWHNRLGHVPFPVLQKLPVTGISAALAPCDSCMLGKQTRLPFTPSVSVTSEIFQLVHADVWGPYKQKTHDNCIYFLTIVEDFSKATWIYLMPDKGLVPSMFRQFIPYVKNQFDKTIKVLRTDNGTEFVNSALSTFLAELGIVHQTSCTYTPQQNGLVERKHRTLLNVARSLRFHAALPLNFWGDCLLTAAYLINRTPSPLLKNKSPYEVLFNELPDYSLLKTFGCLCYATSLPHPTDKFAQRAVKGVFLGYPFAKKGYKVLNLNTRKVFLSRDVKFFETIFPFQSVSTPSIQQLFPAVSSFDDCDPLHLTTEGDRAECSTNSGSPTSENTTLQESAETHSTPASSVPAITQPQPVPARPQRAHKLPVKFTDYTGIPSHLASLITVHSTTSNDNASTLPSYISYLPFDTSYVHFLANITKIPEPQYYKQAVLHDCWCEAMNVELAALEANQTWEVVPLPADKKVVDCRWLYKVKYKANGELERYKARLVAKGFTQTKGVDFFETYAPVAKMTTVRLVLALAAKFNWLLKQLDVTNAFLHGTLDEEVYMALPPGYFPSVELQQRYPNCRLVCRLLKSLYGLCQAPRQWFLALSAALLKFGFKPVVSDSSLFCYQNGSTIALLLVYVDDMILTGNSEPLLQSIIAFLATQFKIKDLGPLKYFLGLEIARSSTGIYVNQRKYTLDIIADTGLTNARSSCIPMEQHHTLQSDESDILSDGSAYRRLIGRLIYLTITRPDLSYPVHVLAQFMAAPRHNHWIAALKVVRYLKETCGQGLLYTVDTNLSLTAFCDADCSSCPTTRLSRTGFCVLLGGSLVGWKCKKQQVVSRSSAEAEYRSLADTCCELTWIVSLLHELNLKSVTPISLFCDNKSALHIASNPVFHERTKHIEIDCHLVRQKLQQGLITTHHISTREQPADLFTKALCSMQLQYFLAKLGVCNLFSPPNLRGDDNGATADAISQPAQQDASSQPAQQDASSAILLDS